MIDAFASAPWYVDHMRPVWLALPEGTRGRFYVSHKAVAAAKGLPGVTVGRVTGDVRPIYVVSYGDLRAVSMTGRAMIAMGQHGAGQSYSTDHPAYPGGRNQGNVSLFLVPNEYSAERTRAAYPRARVELVGCPKLDTLPRKERSGEPVVAFSFHWDGPTIAPEMHSAWSHYRDAVPRLAKSVRVIGHAHPRSVTQLRRWYQAAGIEVVPSFDDVLARADVYACDNSSSLFEFAATGRPVLVLNEPGYRRDVHHGLRFWDAAGVGVNCDRPEDLAGAVEAAIAGDAGTAQRREAALDVVYSPRSGGAELAAAALVDWESSYHPATWTPARRLTQAQRFRSVRAGRPIA